MFDIKCFAMWTIFYGMTNVLQEQNPYEADICSTTGRILPFHGNRISIPCLQQPIILSKLIQSISSHVCFLMISCNIFQHISPISAICYFLSRFPFEMLCISYCLIVCYMQAHFMIHDFITFVTYRVRQIDVPYFKRQLQTNKERYRKNTFICEQQIRCYFTLLGFKNYVR
jgi:hypothetical protein